MDSVNTVIVTYNRLALLQECIAAVLIQTFPLNKIIIVNNASTDGTKDYLATLPASNFVIINQKKNTGGAGGFNAGMKKSVDIGADWTWLMDDDTIPNPDTLEKLMYRSSIVPNTGFLCSRVLWTDGTVHKMNTHVPKNIHGFVFCEYIDDGILLCKSGSFVSCLIKQSVIAAVGFPIADFFIWSDDTEYTLRITNAEFFGLMVIDSIVIHKTVRNFIPQIPDATPDIFWKFYYDQRNKIYLLRGEFPFSLKYLYMFIKTFIINSKQCLKNKGERFKLLSIVFKGMLAGFFFYPKIER
ncbi:glycosyl transferase [Spirochaetia bacterium]|nr:glycosyl transferase [Spirochaetia bacterium]